MSDSQLTLEQLLAAGVHFGHQTRRWNPKMRRFIFAERNGIHIIDLQKTIRQLDLAQKLAREVILRGENVLFVCTKTQLAGIVKEA
ncbi:MAG: 30S ribosomal protein S2, partial [Gemmatimonadaceae bacterium]